MGCMLEQEISKPCLQVVRVMSSRRQDRSCSTQLNNNSTGNQCSGVTTNEGYGDLNLPK